MQTPVEKTLKLMLFSMNIFRFFQNSFLHGLIQFIYQKNSGLTTFENDFKQDYTDLYWDPEDVASENFLGLNFVGHHKTSRDFYRVSCQIVIKCC